MTTTTDHRQAAEAHVRSLSSMLEALPASSGRDQLIAECAALARAIAAFHMEGIRFRMYNVDRAIAKGLVTVPDEARQVFAEVRRHLEAAGFQTRSHAAPTQS